MHLIAHSLIERSQDVELDFVKKQLWLPTEVHFYHYE